MPKRWAGVSSLNTYPPEEEPSSWVGWWWKASGGARTPTHVARLCEIQIAPREVFCFGYAMSLSPPDLAALRREYSLKGLHEKELVGDPIGQFSRWLIEAHTSEILEPNAVIVATVDDSGQPWTRTVLLKVCDARGFTFFTNYDGAKARQIAHEGRVAMTFLWTALERQVNVTGTATKTSREESAEYWKSRPRKSQLGAWASHQSQVLEDRAQLERQHAKAEARFAGSEVPLPPEWGGYTVKPDTVEFWQGAASRLHDRLRYLRVGDGWKVARLSP